VEKTKGAAVTRTPSKKNAESRVGQGLALGGTTAIPDYLIKGRKKKTSRSVGRSHGRKRKRGEVAVWGRRRIGKRAKKTKLYRLRKENANGEADSDLERKGSKDRVEAE